MKQFVPDFLPPKIEIETKEILKKVNSANKALARLNGISKIIPSEAILLNLISLQESKDSSQIENIVTTHDEIYRASIGDISIGAEAKEVRNYNLALVTSYEFVKTDKLLRVDHIVKIQETLERNSAGIRSQQGTTLKSSKTGDIVFVPPQSNRDVKDLLDDLQKYINTPSNLDPLIDMAIIHYQFETIHPFYDGNGRTGRIINILYLVLKELLDMPILYLSGYIIKHKNDYYKLLQEVRTKNNWKEWIMYMLNAVEETSLETTKTIQRISYLMNQTKHKMREELRSVYSKDLLEILFTHPYTRIGFLAKELKVHKETASRKLSRLVEKGFLIEIKIGRDKYFINKVLMDCLRKLGK